MKNEKHIKARDRISQMLLLPYIKGKASLVERTVVLGNMENVFWKAMVNNQRQKLMIQKNDVDRRFGIYRSVVNIFSPKSWNPESPFLKVYTQFIEISKISGRRKFSMD